MAKKKVEVEVVEETQDNDYTPKPHVVYHTERWENDSGTNQRVAGPLPSLDD